MRFQYSHPSDQELLLAAEGELPSRRMEQLRKHVAGCWECRTRAQELEKAIGEFVRLHHANLDPLLPPASGGRALLKAQLDQFAHSDGSQRDQQRTPSRQQLAFLVAAACILALMVLALPDRLVRQQSPMYAGFVPMSFPTAMLTPGVTRAATRAEVCRQDEGKNRYVPPAVRDRVFELYGISRADPKAYEVDYLITPALGGSDDIGNLWPQSYSDTVWNARVKDALEDRLRELVCRGDLDLATAQHEIATDWIAAYKKYFRTDRPITSE